VLARDARFSHAAGGRPAQIVATELESQYARELRARLLRAILDGLTEVREDMTIGLRLAIGALRPDDLCKVSLGR